MKKINAKTPTNFDTLESIDYIWEVLSDYRENCIPEWKLDKDLEDRNRNEAMQRFTNRLFGHQTKRSSE